MASDSLEKNVKTTSRRPRRDAPKRGRLFLSFWNVCLDNLPEGKFRRRRISGEEAKGCIEQARQENRLTCVSHDDLLAPFRKHERENHEALCRALTAHYGIALSERDFLSTDDSDGDPLYFIVPLNCVQVSDHDKLLVVTCNYVLGKKKAHEPLPFETSPTSVEFHMIESA